MKDLSKLNVDDMVYVECFSSMGASSTGPAKVSLVRTKYDEDDGTPYKVVTVGNRDYDTRNGINGMYYIE